MNQVMQCPKCRGTMRTYNRGGVHIEQCDNCRGIFLDYGELESISQAEAGWMQHSYGPPAHGAPAWGRPRHGKHRGMMHMLFSS